MDYYIILTVIILIASAILFMLKNNAEHFIQISDIVLKSSEQTYDEKNNVDNSSVIVKSGNEDTYPLGTNDPKVITPTIPDRVILPDEAFKDPKYIRDPGVETAINNLNKNNEQEYQDVTKSYIDFKLPVDSKDKLSYKKINDFTKTELDDNYIATIHDQMIAKVNENISNEEFSRIMGKPIIQNDIKGLYKPVYTSYDKDYYSSMNETKFKYNAYNKLQLGSMI